MWVDKCQAGTTSPTCAPPLRPPNPKSSLVASWCQLRFIPPSVTRELGERFADWRVSSIPHQEVSLHKRDQGSQTLTRMQDVLRLPSSLDDTETASYIGGPRVA
jgi:hypothetical protein